jgi:glycosyltransferase involved in cell wall biosynthesis
LCHHFESKSINAPETIALVRKRINRDKLAWEVVKDEHPEWNRREKTEGIKLSILIPSVLSRYEKLGRILDQLKPQITDEVEVVVHTDNKKISLGDKRNKLLSLANGEYIVMIDDDDRITEDYVFELLKAIESGAECICYEVECSVNG